MKSLVIGLDEAGRGPILGPMVIACVALSMEAAQHLWAAGVADSKRFGTGIRAHQRRCALVKKILAVADHVGVDVVDVADIDRRTLRGELNQLERERADALLQAAPPAVRIVADGARLFRPLRARHPQLEAIDQAEQAHPAVAAASIVAKVRRDELWQRIAARYAAEFGELAQAGGGYVNAATRRFLRAYCARYRALPPEGRRSWPWGFAADLLVGPCSLPL
ncbi:MAG: hypothetical protein RMK29_02895 [Myxococcales bacterium]|nr:hypothetical protein [Myxococcota bacterium]MDW8280630.1 hypothetical protein [Myxococcales bacterium]